MTFAILSRLPLRSSTAPHAPGATSILRSPVLLTYNANSVSTAVGLSSIRFANGDLQPFIQLALSQCSHVVHFERKRS